MTRRTITITTEAQGILQRLKDRAGLGRVIAGAMDYQNELTIARVQEERLSGPTSDTTLSVRTGMLRRSIRRTNAYVSPNAIISAIGSNLVYAGPLEYGFDGDVAVQAHTREVATSRTKKQSPTITVQVRAHKRHVHITGRHYLEGTVAERMDEIGEGVSSAIIDYAKGGN